MQNKIVRRKLVRLAVSVAFVAILKVACFADTVPSWQALEEEAIRLLGRYNRLLAALNRILQYHAPTKVVSHVQKYYLDSVPLEPAHLQGQYADLKTALRDPAFAAEFTKDPRANAAVRNTIAVTMIKGSEKVNVIPAEASAESDVRLLPGEDPKAFIEELRKTIADSSIKIDVTLSFRRPFLLSILRL